MFIYPAHFFDDRTFSVVPRSCFVIMPFTEAWSARVYSTIRQSVEAVGYTCFRADEVRAGAILTDIWRRINEAEVIIADLTGQNPNVYYELGIAHSLGKEVIPIVQLGTQIPFDQQVFRILFYEDGAAGISILRSSLPSWISSLAYSTSPSLLLRTQDVDRFNEWRARQSVVRLPNEDFARLSLAGLDFHDVNMTDGIFSSAILDGARFDESVLIRTDFRACSLQSASLQKANLSECNMSHTQMNSSNVSEAILIRARIEQSSFEDAAAGSANFSEASLRFTSLARTNLRGANLVRADIKGASFQDSDLAGALIDKRTFDQNLERLTAAENFDQLIITAD